MLRYMFLLPVNYDTDIQSVCALSGFVQEAASFISAVRKFTKVCNFSKYMDLNIVNFLNAIILFFRVKVVNPTRPRQNFTTNL